MRLVSGVPHIAIVGEATWSGFGIFDSGFIQNSQAVRSVRFQVSIEVFRIQLSGVAGGMGSLSSVSHISR
jgi:hypothetical protein